MICGEKTTTTTEGKWSATWIWGLPRLDKKHTPARNGNRSRSLKSAKDQLNHPLHGHGDDIPADARDGLNIEVKGLGRWRHGSDGDAR